MFICQKEVLTQQRLKPALTQRYNPTMWGQKEVLTQQRLKLAYPIATTHTKLSERSSNTTKIETGTTASGFRVSTRVRKKF